MKEALYYTKLKNNRVKCNLCPHNCIIQDGKKGLCFGRINHGGKLYTENYFQSTTFSIDPIEKKPLYNFLPATKIFSISPNGCNFRCKFCQNHQISHKKAATESFNNNIIGDYIKKNSCCGIAFTYSEPLIWFETIKEISEYIHTIDKVSVLVTNGFCEKAPFLEISKHIDAYNIDIKSMNPQFYKKICKGKLNFVLDNCIIAKTKGHLEITNLIIPGMNDSENETIELVKFILKNLGKDTPLHFSRYFPRNKINIEETPIKTLINAYNIASQYLDYVYIGNIPTDQYSISICYNCKEVLIKRSPFYNVSISNKLKIVEGFSTCTNCKSKINIKIKE